MSKNAGVATIDRYVLPAPSWRVAWRRRAVDLDLGGIRLGFQVWGISWGIMLPVYRTWQLKPVKPKIYGVPLTQAWLKSRSQSLNPTPHTVRTRTLHRGWRSSGTTLPAHRAAVVSPLARQVGRTRYVRVCSVGPWGSGNVSFPQTWKQKP